MTEPAAEHLPEPAPGRSRITAQRAKAAAAAPYPASAELAEQSPLGRMLLRSLLRSQLRLALTVGGGFLVLLCAVPLTFALIPALNQISFGGIPLLWLVLGAGLYPIAWISAWLYQRTAERNEATFRDLVSGK
ncbi:hypothetical protein ODZ83_06275 [Acaricomes phytoseiuli]|uniref:hypothetical protein n=1 Tax=Acaricomes phytoseiuli TaxID=291968 RepID=UPI002223AF18|nr:hypothetical protein [Acaricomes phytoseiuli]MCW1249796.1 hypothetical protein [Acaricomes phytoseiuli]